MVNVIKNIKKKTGKHLVDEDTFIRERRAYGSEAR